jgi:hypothetical protein
MGKGVWRRSSLSVAELGTCGDEVQAAELPLLTATWSGEARWSSSGLTLAERLLGGRIGTRGGSSRSLLDPHRYEGDGGRRFLGVLL